MQLLAGRPTVSDPEQFLAALREAAGSDVAVQAFDARYIAGRDHLERAVALARRERERGAGIADSLAVEVLCYAAGRRQIEDALQMGVDQSTDGVVVAILAASGETPTVGSADGLEAAIERLQDRFDLGAPGADDAARDLLESLDESRLESFFEVTTAEREAALAELPEIVAERVALLVVDR